LNDSATSFALSSLVAGVVPAPNSAASANALFSLSEANRLPVCHSSGSHQQRGEIVKKVLLALAALGVLATAGSASTAWDPVGTNLVASSPVAGGGYPVPPGSTKPLPGTCGAQMLNSNHSES